MLTRLEQIDAINADLAYHYQQRNILRARLTEAVGLERITCRARFDEHQRAVSRLEQKKRNYHYQEFGFDSMGFNRD